MMRRKIRCLIGSLLVLSLCCGCGTTTKSVDELTDESNSELSALMSEGENGQAVSEGSISMGFQPSDQDEYTYLGSEMEVPLYVGVEGNAETVEAAAILFLNGEVQPYAYEVNGEVSEQKTVHYFQLGKDETVNINALVTPATGQRGEVLGMQFATVFRSDYLPKEDGNPSFGNCGRMNATVCVPVKMNASAASQTRGERAETEVTDLPEEVTAMFEGLITDDTDHPLDYSPYLEIKTENDRHELSSEEGKLYLTLQAYGGKEVTQKITFFVNHEPVKVGDFDYVEMKTTANKMTVFSVCIDVSQYDEICSFYAVAAAKGEDYLIQDDLIQSERSLLLNK